MSALPRRTTLAMLGFAPTSAAVGMESFKGSEKLDGLATGDTKNLDIAAGLRHLAEQVEAGRVFTMDIDLNSSLKPGDIMKHTLSIAFCYAPDA